uniref:Pkinase_fungal domain-containing protein n=1 Tax=Panagrellus redivivus TaxID=6233 RepID=A0A7E4VZ67_PANRE
MSTFGRMHGLRSFGETEMGLDATNHFRCLFQVPPVSKQRASATQKNTKVAMNTCFDTMQHFKGHHAGALFDNTFAHHLHRLGGYLGRCGSERTYDDNSKRSQVAFVLVSFDGRQATDADDSARGTDEQEASTFRHDARRKFKKFHCDTASRQVWEDDGLLFAKQWVIFLEMM